MKKEDFFMKIIKILNCSDYNADECITKLKELSKLMRCSNKKTIIYITEFLSEYILPVNKESPFKEFFQAIDSRIIINLEEILRLSSNAYFNAVCGEFLWSKQHETNYASISINSYLKLLTNPYYSKHKYNFSQLTIGISRIYSRYKFLIFALISFLIFALII